MSARGKLQQLIEDLREVEDESHTAEPESSSTITFGLSTITTETSEGHDAISERSHVPHNRGSDAGSVRLLKQLQEKVVELLSERKQHAVQHAQQLQDKEVQIERLQQYIETQLFDLQQRQQQVESKAPEFQRQLKAAQSALKDLHISEERYQELKQRGPSELSLSEYVSLVVHEQLKTLRSDNEQLRLAASAARSTTQRLQSEVAALQRDNTRLAAALVEEQRDADATTSALQQRADRLCAELQEAAVQVEVLSAKGRMYDDLQNKADQLEGEVLRLTASEVAVSRLTSEVEELRAAAREREHRQELLLTDKAYLRRQVEDLEVRLSSREEEVEGLRSKVAELKEQRQDLYQKLADTSTFRHTQDEDRLQHEISRMQAATTADLERIRREASEAAERELRAMRELRDAAQDEAARTKAELRSLREQHEELLVRHREEVGRLDVQGAVLLGEQKLKALELQRMQALAEERASSVSSMQLQVEMLTDKVRVLTDQLYALDSSSSRRTAELKGQLEAAESQLAQYQALEQLQGMGPAGGLSIAAAVEQQRELGPAQEQRVQHNLRLAARCARLETERRLLAQQKQEAEAAAAAAQAQLAVANQRLARVGAPQGLLLQQLQETEERAELAEVQLQQLQVDLATKERAAAGAAAERAAIKADLERVLKERGALDSLKQLMVSALGRGRVAAAEG